MTDGARKGNWRDMHMGRGDKPKIAHWTRLGAWWHKQRHMRHLKVGADVLTIYPCWFTDDNRIGRRRHWHVGHARKAPWMRGSIGRRVRAAGAGGYLLTMSLTESELRQLEQMAGERPIQEFAVRAVLGLARTGTTCCHVSPDDCMMTASRNSRRLRSAAAPEQ